MVIDQSNCQRSVSRRRPLQLLFTAACLLAACSAPPASPTGPANTDAQPATISTAQEPTNQSAPTSTPVTEVESREEIGVITFFDGDVTVDPSSAGGIGFRLARVQAQPSRRPRSMQTVRRGDRLNVAEGGVVTIVCRNNRLLRIKGGTTTVLRSCNGASIPARAQRGVVPRGGTVAVNRGSKILVGESREREGDYGNIPIILSPRNSALIDLKPVIRWVAVKDAIEYVLNLSGPDSFGDINLAAEGLSCTDDERSAPNLVCETPWPDAWPLEPGKRYFLTVNARTGIASPLRTSEKSALRTLTAAVVAMLQTDVDVIQALDADDVTKELLLAGLYAGQGVEADDVKQSIYAEALPRYERVAKIFPSPVLYTTLGDAYRAVDLQRYAYRSYEAAIRLLEQTEEDSAVRAAAEFGMGQVEYNRLNFRQAEPHFAKAVELYNSVGAGTEEELTAAQTALEEARKRM